MTNTPTRVEIDSERHMGNPRAVKAALRAGQETDSAIVGVVTSQAGLSRHPVYVSCEQALNPDVRQQAKAAARALGPEASFHATRDVPSIQAQCNLPAKASEAGHKGRDN